MTTVKTPNCFFCPSPAARLVPLHPWPAKLVLACEKCVAWADKMRYARRSASHYNTRMMIRAHHWTFADGQTKWEYVVTPADRPRPCLDGPGRAAGAGRE